MRGLAPTGRMATRGCQSRQGTQVSRACCARPVPAGRSRIGARRAIQPGDPRIHPPDGGSPLGLRSFLPASLGLVGVPSPLEQDAWRVCSLVSRPFFDRDDGVARMLRHAGPVGTVAARFVGRVQIWPAMTGARPACVSAFWALVPVVFFFFFLFSVCLSRWLVHICHYFKRCSANKKNKLRAVDRPFGPISFKTFLVANENRVALVC